MSTGLDSPILADLASQDLAQLAQIFARAYVRFSACQNSQNELDDVGDDEASCAGMKIEPNGAHACAAHATDSAREMTANERLDHAAETGEPVRCAQCAAEAKR
jgi:hypothetical protein